MLIRKLIKWKVETMEIYRHHDLISFTSLELRFQLAFDNLIH